MALIVERALVGLISDTCFWLMLFGIFLQGVNSEYESRLELLQDNEVIISIPGDYSRKPPIGGIRFLIFKYLPFAFICLNCMLHHCCGWFASFKE